MDVFAVVFLDRHYCESKICASCWCVGQSRAPDQHSWRRRVRRRTHDSAVASASTVMKIKDVDVFFVCFSRIYTHVGFINFTILLKECRSV